MSDWHLFWRMFRAERWANALVVLVTGIGFTIYAFLASWNQAALSGENLRAEELRLPADVVVVTPPWLQEAERPEMSLDVIATTAEIGGDGTHPGDARATSTALAVPVLTGAGTVRAWGVNPDDRNLLASIRVVEGSADLRSGAIVSADFAEAVGARPGSTVRVSAIGPDHALRTATLPVAGLYDAGGPAFQALVVARDDLARLSGYSEDNALFLWQQPADPGVRVRGPEGLTRVRPLAEVVPDYLRYTRAPRMPYDFAPATPVDHFEGAPLPFDFLTGQFMLYPGLVRDTVLGTTAVRNRNLTTVAMALFALMAFAVTILQVIRVLDGQRTLGILKVLGRGPGHLLWLHGLTGAVDMVLAMLLARGLFEALAGVVSRAHGLRLAFHPGVWLVWAFAAGLLAAWAGKVPSILAGAAPIRALLQREGRFDWLALIRF